MQTVEKVAIISRQETALIPNVREHTSVVSVKDQNHSINVNSAFNLDAWTHALQGHPDPEFTYFILEGIKHGVDIGHCGIATTHTSDNWPSALKYRDAVESTLAKDISRGRKSGPFDHPPPHFIGSPLGAFEKKRSPGKHRVIHDLSWPPGQSVNEGIYVDCSVRYVTIDHITDRIKSFGKIGVKISKLDLEDAYKHIFVRPEDRHLLGCVWDYIDDKGDTRRKYFMDLTLPFGLN